MLRLKNPKTDSYIKLKELILSNRIPWYYHTTAVNPDDTGDYNVSEYSKEHINAPFFGHCFLKRPDCDDNRYSIPESNYLPYVDTVVREICDFNNVTINCFLRLNANLLFPLLPLFKEKKFTFPHIDHDFPHKNILLYLTNAGGETIVGKEIYDPKEDDVIIFDGDMHYVKIQKEKPRYVIVGTYI